MYVLCIKECIPEQGEVKKKTTGLNKEWRKKYLVLGEETLTYYPSIQVSCCLVNAIEYVHTAVSKYGLYKPMYVDIPKFDSIVFYIIKHN